MRFTRRFSVAILIALIAAAAGPAIPTVPPFPASGTRDGERIRTEIASGSVLAILRECAAPRRTAGSLMAQEPPPGNPTLAGCIAGCVYAGEAAEEAEIDPATIWEIVKACKANCVEAHGPQ